MTYSPGNPGYPAQSPGPYGTFNQGFATSTDATKLPRHLLALVVALGFASYLASFGPMLTASESGPGRFVGHGSVIVMPLALLAALLAAVGLLPKAKNYTPVVAVVAVLAALLAIARVVTRSGVYSIGWAMWLVLALTVLQAVAAVGALLLEAGVLTAPAPRPKYDPYAPYGLPPGAGYYGQPGQPGAQHRRSPQGPPAQPGYPSYGGSYSPGPSTGGFSTSHSEQQGPPTPPTGFPGFGSPSTGGPGAGGQNPSSTDPGQAGHAEQPPGERGTGSSSSTSSESTQP